MYKRLDMCQTQWDGTLRDAMLALDSGAVEIALVVDESCRLVGTLTDGDIRRALLNGASLTSPLDSFVHRSFTSVGPSVSRAEVLDLMQARTISQVPILDEEGRVLGLHLLHELVGAVERPHWAVVMAGGKGSRLGSITQQIPKPMLRVAGRPILERLVLHLVGSGIRRIFLAVNYLGSIVEEHFQCGERFGCKIEYLRETAPLGTGGPLSLLPEAPVHPVLVLNGDLVTEPDLGAMIDFHERGDYKATLAVKEYLHLVPYGCVDMDGDNVTRLQEKPVLSQKVNGGIYVISPELVARVPGGEEFPLTALIEQSVSAGERVGGFLISGDWADVGLPEQLRRAREGAI